TRRAPERSLRKQQQSKLACVQKRQSLRLGDVIDGVGVKEWIERLGGPAHGRECITSGPAIDFSDVFDKKCVPKLVAQGNAPQSCDPRSGASVCHHRPSVAPNHLQAVRQVSAAFHSSRSAPLRLWRADSSSTKARFWS